MELYRHTQQSPLWIAVALAAIIVVGVTGYVLAAATADAAGLAVAAVAFLIVGGTVVAFSRLTVTVTDSRLRLTFGAGWPAKTIDLSEVAAAAPVRNKWWYGYGIRKIPRGWMWNVWGLDAVELTLGTGKVFRIGTDRPDELMGVLRGRVPRG